MTESYTNEQIPVILKDIEKEFQVTIIFAAESGSRCWGWSSDIKSDWDIKFVYCHPLQWYLSIDEGRRDVIEYKIGKAEFLGYDIKKAMKMAREMNPGICECISSRLPSLTYRAEQPFTSICESLIVNHHSKKSIAFHYLNVATKHQKLNFVDKICVLLKKYFYVIRPLLCIKFLKCHQTDLIPFPPAKIQDLIKNISVPTEEYQALQQLLDQKINGTLLKSESPRIEILDKWIDSLFTDALLYCKSLETKELPPTIPFSDLAFTTILAHFVSQPEIKNP